MLDGLYMTNLKYTKSNIIPSGLHTGFLNGVNDKLQQKNGSYEYGIYLMSYLPPHSKM